MICCLKCGQPFPVPQFPYKCSQCSGLFGFPEGLSFIPDEIDSSQPGIWRYKRSFALPDHAPVVTLGEGNTPLVWSSVQGNEVAFKLESLNPTGSFKDRGTAVLVSWLITAGIDRAVEDSSGNAGSSFAAYASRAGIEGKIFIPAYASGPKRNQIEAYGSDVIPISGPRSKAAEAVLEEVNQGAVYASHAYLPHGMAGIATIAYELVDELGEPPGTVLLPVGHGSLLTGIWLGFQALLKSGLISQQPKLIGIQAAACDPLYQAYQAGQDQPVTGQEGKTLAEGVAIADPYHGEIVLHAVRESGGTFLNVEEDRIRSGQSSLARLGIYAELTSALIWDGLHQLPADLPDPIISIISGHGLKGD
jgi:threonine synthase